MARQSSFTYEELLACGRGELFGAGNAQLPLPPMLMFDRITSIGEDGGAYGKGHVVAELDVRPDLFGHCKAPLVEVCGGMGVTMARLAQWRRQLGDEEHPAHAARKD